MAIDTRSIFADAFADRSGPSAPRLMGGPALLIPFLLFRALSRLIWRIPGRDAMKMAEFSHVELGSGLDMLAATQAATDPLLRRKYFIHALDELKHSRMFRERAQILAVRAGTGDRVGAVLEDAGFISEHGINQGEPLCKQLTEMQLLAFVWLHERQGAAQFSVYSELMGDDADSRVMFEEIARDERFHITYARAELERRAQKTPWTVRQAVWWVRLRDVWQAWGRLSFKIGDIMSGFWLSLLYYIVLAPFALAAQKREKMVGGLQASPALTDPKAYAQEP